MTPASLESMQVGDVLAGKYRVERVLGRGAMGMVVAAMHVDLHERRAIKFMLPTALGDAEGLERFMREARACARLKSKHVATVYDFGRLENGAPYIVMEYLEGSDLKDVLHQKKALPVPLAVDYMLQALEAVGEAHHAGIVHRDLKPANMFLAAGVGGVPCIKVLDFGIAKLSSTPGVDVQEMTSTAVAMGSPLYMSPEQMKSSRQVDPRSDIWALGIILFRMVTGTLPFQAPTSPELYAAILKDPAPLPCSLNPTLPRGLESILLKCLEKDPSRRWQSAAELADALRPYLVEGAGQAPALEADGTTRYWRPPQASLPDGWYGAGSGVGGESTRSRRGGPASSGSGAQQAQTAPPASGGGAAVAGNVALASNALAQPGSSPVASAPSSIEPAPHSGHLPPAGAVIAGQAGFLPGGVLERGPTGQTGSSWSQTATRMKSSTISLGTIAAMAIGGGLFFAAVLGAFLMLRHTDAAGASTSSQPSAAAEPIPPPVQVGPAPSQGRQDPLPMPTGTSTAPPQATSTPSSRPSTKKTASPGPSSKPTPNKTAPNPFD